jgi:hypothetical protein
MPVDERRLRGQTIRAAAGAYRDGGHGLCDFPELLLQIIRTEAWRDFVLDDGRPGKASGSYAAFITEYPPDGLGGKPEIVARLLKDHREALDAHDQALKRPHGGPRVKGKVDNINLAQPDGTSETHALRRLRKDQPELHADVLAGRLSAHAAMVQAGYRKRTVSVPVTDPEAAARSLRRHMTAEHLARLHELLGDMPAEQQTDLTP